MKRVHIVSSLSIPQGVPESRVSDRILPTLVTCWNSIPGYEVLAANLSLELNLHKGHSRNGNYVRRQPSNSYDEKNRRRPTLPSGKC